MMAVRELGQRDWRLWRQVRLAALADAPDMFGSAYADWVDADEARWRRRLTGLPLHATAMSDGQPAGVVSLTEGVSTAHPSEWELISMWVAPWARGRGVGDLLVRYAIDWVDRYAPGNALRLSVREHNTHAIELYERHGFRAAGRDPHSTCEITMRRPAQHR